ncbi:hypothetical protein EVAR_45044_1 [Eumeta japonica]|uniref:Uncharacterized protein n=1 Tax=Eumeta variegata TaxID=151549 RepID=A0A4C1SA87_EUMVA|nr:hypothetical protein EVAR_45044_1 [Eumeta japonica]
MAHCPEFGIGCLIFNSVQLKSSATGKRKRKAQISLSGNESTTSGTDSTVVALNNEGSESEGSAKTKKSLNLVWGKKKFKKRPDVAKPNLRKLTQLHLL